METTRLIEMYLDGTLTPEERISLEERGERSKEFRKLMQLHKEVNESIRDNDLFKFREMIREIGKDYPVEDSGRRMQKKTGQKPLGFFLRMAAFLVFAAAAGIILRFVLFNPPSAEQIFQKYYAPYNLDVVYRSGLDAKEPLDAAILDYNRGHCQDALTTLNEILAADQSNHMAWLYKGLALMETGDPGSAIQAFTAIPEPWLSTFAEHRDWFLALSYLKTNNIGKASGLFRQIASGGGYYAKRAEKILRKLSS